MGDPERIADAERSIWAMVELLRDRQVADRERDSVRGAAARLAKQLGEFADVRDGPTAVTTSFERLRTLHKAAEKRMACDAGFKRFAEFTLAGLRERRAKRGWREHPLELLLNW
jgi:hypothetical protein